MTLHEYLVKESSIEKELDQFSVSGLPVWRYVRFSFRIKYLNIVNRSSSPVIRKTKILSDTLKSFWKGLCLILSRKKVSTVIIPHPRLYYVGNQYLDRLTDPIIDASGIRDYMILERRQNGEHRKPRVHDDKVMYMDFIDNMALVMTPLYKPFFSKKYKKQIDGLYQLLDKTFKLNDETYKKRFLAFMTRKVLTYYLARPIIKSLSPKRVFMAPRGSFDHIIHCCKELGITTIELQHGITPGETELYSGSYNPAYDTDYFFSFGQANVGPQFGIPVDRIKNIGFAYKDYVKTIGLEKYSNKVSLVISEPHITEILTDVIILLAKVYPECEFHIRNHPQEKITDEIKAKTKDYPNISFVSNKVESFCALSQYDNIIGENSSVMYEAMSMHKKVGRLNFDGLKVIESDMIHGGYKINSVEDFKQFMTQPYSDENDSKEVYSDFNVEVFKSVID